jgi:hypothetical protein
VSHTIGSGAAGNPSSRSRFGKSRPKASAAPFTRKVAANTTRISGSRRASSTPRRKIDNDSRQRCSRVGVKPCSVNATMTNPPSPSMATPATTIAVERSLPQASAPKPSRPTAAPTSCQRALAVSTPAARSGWSSSSVSHATSAPLEKVQLRPHNICVATSAGKAVTSPVANMLTPISRCATTTERLRLIVSAMTPVGTSKAIAVRPCAVPRNTSWNADSSASTTRYKLVTSHQPRWKIARAKVHRRKVVATSRSGIGERYSKRRPRPACVAALAALSSRAG